jgi:methyl coenzyme M reductase gamma subunit
MLRLVACGIIGLGAALLIAALLLSTYTAGKIRKIPLDIDTTWVSAGTGTALDPASLSGERFIIDRDVPLTSQQAITVEAPANAEVVTLQVGTTVRRSDKQQENGLLLAMVDTVTVNRSTAEAVSDDDRPGGSVQKPRSIGDDKPATPAKHERPDEVARLVYLAVRSLPEGLEGPARDREVRRIGKQWGLTEAELAAEGYRV